MKSFYSTEPVRARVKRWSSANPLANPSFSLAGKWNPDTLPMDAYMKCTYAVIDAIVCNQSSQIGGVTVLLDCSTVTKKQLSHWEDPKVIFKVMRCWQDAYPIRAKGFVYWKEPLIFDFLFNMMKAVPFIKKKFKDRVSFVHFPPACLINDSLLCSCTSAAAM